MLKRGILFDEIHSFNDLDLILAPLVIPPAKPKTNFLDVPGGNGSLDLTEANGEVKYYDREIKITFTVNPLSDMSFDEKITQVSNLLNGKACKITLDRDPDWYWEGRLSVDEHLQDKNLKQIVIIATVRPYKLKQELTEFAFALSSTAKTAVLTNSRKTVIPEITCTNSSTKVTFDGATYVLDAGTCELLEIQLVQGENEVTIQGTGTIIFSYREGVL